MRNFVNKMGKTAKEPGFVKINIEWLEIMLLSIV